MAKKSFADTGYQPRYTAAEQTKMVKAMDSHQPDNGKVHYGAGMRASVCGVDNPKRQERCENRGITCPTCIKILRARP